MSGQTTLLNIKTISKPVTKPITPAKSIVKPVTPARLVTKPSAPARAVVKPIQQTKQISPAPQVKPIPQIKPLSQPAVRKEHILLQKLQVPQQLHSGKTTKVVLPCIDCKHRFKHLINIEKPEKGELNWCNVKKQFCGSIFKYEEYPHLTCEFKEKSV
jgi:hypothetical protein